MGVPGVGEVDREARRIFRCRDAGQGGAAAQLRPDRTISPPPHREEQSADGILFYWTKPINILIANCTFLDLVTSIHEHWFCARCVNTTQPGGEGVIVMQIGAYLLVSMYDGSVGSASQAMVAVDQFAWHFNRRTH
ncbi:uncharacterized protein [Triticum aestivum]|uniref:uncharacterized protein isoform X4 n=1 Tax=Triticum aestivum TaxID=4565 RepID=UPI001D013E3D|nr:uncharacterized protein LOC123081863 isoform X4 [Triticum aestivum]